MARLATTILCMSALAVMASLSGCAKRHPASPLAGEEGLVGRWQHEAKPGRHCATEMELFADGSLIAVDEDHCDVLVSSYLVDHSTRPPELSLEGNRCAFHQSDDELRLMCGGQTSVLHRVAPSQELPGTLATLAGSWRGLAFGYTSFDLKDDGTAMFEDKPASIRLIDGGPPPHRLLLALESHLTPCIYRVTKQTLALLCGEAGANGFPTSFRVGFGSAQHGLGFWRDATSK